MSYDPQKPPIDPYASPAHSGFAPPPSGANNQLAIAALATGIAGLGSSVIGFCCCPIVGIPLPAIAVGVGIFALRDPRTDVNGRTMAMIGIGCGALGLFIALAWTIFSLAMFGFGALEQGARPRFD